MLSRHARNLLSHALLVSFLIIGPGLVPISPAEASVRTDDPPPSTGRAPSTAATAAVGLDSLLSLSTGSAAFALDISAAYLRYIPDTDLPGEWTTVDAVTGTYYAGDFVGRDYSKIYVIDETTKQLHTLNTQTGVTTTIGSCPSLVGHTWTGATGTPDGTLYAASTDGAISYLYTINTAAGTASTVGRIYNAPVIIDIAINADGEMYGLDIGHDNLVRINTSTGAGTVIGSIGFDANYVQGMDFDPVTGVLYLAAYNNDWGQGELRTVNTSAGSSTLIGAFKDDHEVAVWAMTPSWAQYLWNPGFESGLAYWGVDSAIPAGTAHSGSGSVLFNGEESYVWQDIVIPADAVEVVLAYWITGATSESYYNEDIACAAIRDLTWSIEYVDEVCFDLHYFLTATGWRHRVHRLSANELANVRGRIVRVGFWLVQDWGSYSQPSTAYIDDTAVLITRPIYDYAVYLPLTIR